MARNLEGEVSDPNRLDVPCSYLRVLRRICHTWQLHEGTLSDTILRCLAPLFQLDQVRFRQKIMSFRTRFGRQRGLLHSN